MSELYVVVTGSPFDGMSVHGPFEDGDAAIKWAESNAMNADWWAVQLVASEEGPKFGTTRGTVQGSVSEVPNFDNGQAFMEGWGIFDCGEGRAKHHRFELQRDDESDEFVEDGDAWKFVVGSAIKGSAYHRNTLVWLYTYSIAEYAAICREAGVPLSTFGA